MVRWIVLLLWAMASLATAATPGIPVGTQFKIPVVNAAGKTVQARAYVTTDKVLHLMYVEADEVDMLDYLLTKQTPSPTPDPGPNPQPDPKPDPKPPADLWSIIIEESSARTPQIATVLASQKIRALFPKRWKLVDPVDDEGKPVPVSADVKPYVDKAKDKKLPWLFLVDAGGTVYFEGPMPLTVAEFETLYLKTKGASK